MNLVIVESPAKAKTINKYLGNDYNVLASFGHVRDLPSKNGSVDPENDFSFEWEVSNTSKKHIKEIYDAAESSSNIFVMYIGIFDSFAKLIAVISITLRFFEITSE